MVMKRPCGLKIICFLMMLILLNASNVGGQSVQRFFEWEPFKARIDLELPAPSAIREYERSALSDKASSHGEFFKGEMEVSNGNGERILNIYYNQKILQLFHQSSQLTLLFYNQIPFVVYFSQHFSQLIYPQYSLFQCILYHFTIHLCINKKISLNVFITFD